MLKKLLSAPIAPPGSRAGKGRGAHHYSRLFMKDAIRYLIAFAMFAAVFALYDYMSRQPATKYVPQKVKARQMASNTSAGK